MSATTTDEEYPPGFKEQALAQYTEERKAKEEWEAAVFRADELERKFYEISKMPHGPAARRLSTLERFRQNDPDELLMHRFLCRKGALLVCGPTGIGKSALGMQCAVLWALGRPAFGIQPKSAIRSLIIQAENDDGDIAEMRDGVVKGLQLNLEESESACSNILFIREDSRSGKEFLVEVVRPLLKEHKPDLLWIDPALSYLGGDMNSQKDVGTFLRNGLNPLLNKFNCGAVVVHHTNKPTVGREKPDWSGNDFAYLGAGSAEWANWARAVLAIRSVNSKKLFQLQAGKRGVRLRWTDKAGMPVTSKFIAHSKDPSVICWSEVNEEDIEDQLPKLGRSKDDETMLLPLLSPDGLTSTEWQNKAKDELGINKSSFFNLLKRLESNRRVVKERKKWKPLPA